MTFQSAKRKNTTLKVIYTISYILLALCGLAILGWLAFYFIMNNAHRFEFANTALSYVFVFGTILLEILFFVLVIRMILSRHEMDNVGMGGPGEMPSKQKVRSSKNRFQLLSKLDEEHPTYTHIQTSEDLTLEKLCDDFRNFASKELNLYYSIQDIRNFIASLGVSKILILQGMSGTGKTSLPVAFGRYIQNSTTVIPVQPMWKERSDLLGYYNEFTGKFNETMILEKLYEANQSDNVFIIVLDELNIARVEYYFAEFLSLLELPQASKRVLEVTSTISKKDPVLLVKGKLQLPDNVWFIGTANNDDSTFAISDKVYDRSMIMNLDNRAESFEVEEETPYITISQVAFQELVDQAKREYSLTMKERRHIKEFDKYLTDNFNVTFGNRIMRQIENYVPIYIACGGSELEAVDDILAKKVLRKLEARNPVYVKTHAEELISRINEIFGVDSMKVCELTIRKITKNG